MLATKVEQAKREEGFTLIELLVVVIIIGILAAIAIPVFLNQRQSAWQGSVESDVRNAAIQVETYATRNNGDLPANYAAFSDDIELSDGVQPLTYNETGNFFTICGQHENLSGESVTYNSAEGGLQDWATTGCGGGGGGD